MGWRLCTGKWTATHCESRSRFPKAQRRCCAFPAVTTRRWVRAPTCGRSSERRRRVRLSDIRIRDPFILESSPGSFVLFGTTDENVWGGPATGFDCYTSSDLDRWEGPIEAFRPPEGFWSDTQFWAPEVHAHDGRFFMFATFVASSSRVRGVAVLVSDQPTGPFVPWSDGPLTPPGIPCLDGTLFMDDDSQPWLVYSRGSEGI